VNKSYGQFKIEDNKIIFALGAIKNVTATLGDIIANERKIKPFTSVIDFIERIPSKSLNKRALENLIKAGSFDDLHPNRAKSY
jgi:DNA polymerase-3 subunit alpha